MQSVRHRGSSDTQNISEEVFSFLGSRRRVALRNFNRGAQTNERWDDVPPLARVGAQTHTRYDKERYCVSDFIGERKWGMARVIGD
jgi:hypothetical protein